MACGNDVVFAMGNHRRSELDLIRSATRRINQCNFQFGIEANFIEERDGPIVDYYEAVKTEEDRRRQKKTEEDRRRQKKK